MPEALDLPFVQRGLAEVALLSIGAGLIGTWIVLRGLAFYSHAVGTAAFPGLVLADGVGFAAPIGALGAAVVFALLMAAVSGRGRPHGRGSDDRGAEIALILVGMLALGVILASDVFESSAGIETLLFGSLLLVNGGDLLLAAVVSALAFVAAALGGRHWVARGFDAGGDGAVGRGARRGRGAASLSRLSDLALVGLIGLATAAALTAVGALLVAALFVVPAATARLFTSRLRSWQVASIMLCAAEASAGVLLSVELNAPPGATIAVVSGAVFALAALASRARRRPGGGRVRPRRGTAPRGARGASGAAVAPGATGAPRTAGHGGAVSSVGASVAVGATRAPREVWFEGGLGPSGAYGAAVASGATRAPRTSGSESALRAGLARAFGSAGAAGLALVVTIGALGAVVATLALLSGGGGASPGAPIVATTPIAGDLATGVAGNGIGIRTLLQPNTDPHDYEPRPHDIEALAGAELVIASGGEVDGWIDDALDDAGSDAELLVLADAIPHPVAGDGGAADPHWWLDPRNAEAAVERIGASVARLDPARAVAVERRASAVGARIAAADAAAAACLDAVPAGERKLVTDHDAFAYLGGRYGLEIVGAVIPARTTAAQPSAGELAELRETIDREGVLAVFPEASVSDDLARAIAAETGASADYELYGDTLGPEGSAAETYLKMIRANAESLVRGLTGGELGCK